MVTELFAGGGNLGIVGVTTEEGDGATGIADEGRGFVVGFAEVSIHLQQGLRGAGGKREVKSEAR